jgi:hypothetical protein
MEGDLSRSVSSVDVRRRENVMEEIQDRIDCEE